MNIHISATTHGGHIASVTGVPSAFRLTIRTTDATATGDPETLTSAYGRGTTTADQAAGNTSLRFHESRHGVDFLSYLQSNPRPEFTGTVGMTVAAFQQALTQYMTAHQAWLRGMDAHSVRQTDCVGSATIDDQHQGQAGYQLQCTP
jgi:hypothetical protein